MILHNNQDKNNLINKYFIALIPLILFSIYKNGILLYTSNLINLRKVFIPIYFYVISIIIGFLIAKILKESAKENILICLIISLTISINTNMLIYPILLFVSVFISKYIINKAPINFNIISFTHLVLLLALLINSYSYLNIAEKLQKFNYNYFDIFLGLGKGSLATTSLILCLIGFIILITSKYYKKLIAITSSITFIILNIIIILITKNYHHLEFLLSGMYYFNFIFIAPNSYSSPLIKRGMVIYGIIIGLFSTILLYLGLEYEAPFLSVFLCSLFTPLIDKLNQKNYMKKAIN